MDLSSLGASYSATLWPSPSLPNARVTADPQAQRANDADEEAASDETTPATAGPTRPDGTPLEPEEIQQLEQLKQTDRAVRQHEMAHQTVGGPYTGGATYEYEIGPDGQRYAVAGEVSIDYGPVPGAPQATIEKMQTVIAAALAPADPSPKDLQVAAQARQYLLEARLEAAREQSEMNQARSGGGTDPSAPESATAEQAA